MVTESLDARGLRCPHPTLKIAVKVSRLQRGDQLEVLADCPTFERDVRDYCERSGAVLLWLREEGGRTRRCLLRV